MVKKYGPSFENDADACLKFSSALTIFLYMILKSLKDKYTCLIDITFNQHHLLVFMFLFFNYNTQDQQHGDTFIPDSRVEVDDVLYHTNQFTTDKVNSFINFFQYHEGILF